MQIELIKKQLERTFNGPAWYGPPIMDALSKIKQGQAANTHKDSHSIIEIIGHMTAWRDFVVKRLTGDNDFEVSDEMNFPKLDDLALAIAALQASQQSLIEAISSFPEERLKEKVGGRSYSFQAMLHGIIHHDLYHLGQISLLNR
jgi:uncharacterized damage-inducible protein DinB